MEPHIYIPIIPVVEMYISEVGALIGRISRIYIAGKIVGASGYPNGVGRRRTSCWEINCCMNIVRG